MSLSRTDGWELLAACRAVDNEKGSQMARNGCMPAAPLETGQNETVLLGVDKLNE